MPVIDYATQVPCLILDCPSVRGGEGREHWDMWRDELGPLRSPAQSWLQAVAEIQGNCSVIKAATITCTRTVGAYKCAPMTLCIIINHSDQLAKCVSMGVEIPTITLNIAQP